MNNHLNRLSPHPTPRSHLNATKHLIYTGPKYICIHHNSPTSQPPCRLRLAVLARLVLLRKVQADAVDAVPLVRRRVVPLALEDVAEVPAAVGAHNLGAGHAQRAVLVAHHGAGDGIVVGRPAAARLELVVRLVEGRVAAGAVVGARVGAVLVILAGAGALGALFAEDAELFWGLSAVIHTGEM